MKANRASWALLVAVSVLASACEGGASQSPSEDGPGSSRSFEQPFTDAEAYPVIASSEVTVGKNRFLIGPLDGNDAPIASPKIDLDASFYDLDDSTADPVTTADMRFIWTVRPRTGLYVDHVHFDEAGDWGVEVRIRGPGIDETVRSSFEVTRQAGPPAIGEPAPASDTPTASDVRRLRQISTDRDPNPRFYRNSIADAVRSGRPSVITFATPKFCSSATCGPTLDVVKGVARSWPRVNFVHVEPYKLPFDASTRAVVPAVREWGLPSEPWVFVVDAKGKVAAKFEGTLAPQELNAALERL